MGAALAMYVAVVPTAGDRPRTLNHLVDNAGIPVVVVHTTEQSRHHPAAVNVTDLGEPNIHRWWNVGIRQAEDMGATLACVVNDDIWPADDTQLAALASLTEKSGATIGYQAPALTSVQTHRGLGRVMVGWCFALNLSHGLRPNENFRWYFGDDWLCYTARAEHQGVIGAPLAIRHVKKGAAFPPEFAPLIAKDRVLIREFHRKWVRGQ